MHLVQRFALNPFLAGRSSRRHSRESTFAVAFDPRIFLRGSLDKSPLRRSMLRLIAQRKGQALLALLLEN